MNTKNMANVLGAGKWLIAIALVGCGGAATDPFTGADSLAGQPSGGTRATEQLQVGGGGAAAAGTANASAGAAPVVTAGTGGQVATAGHEGVPEGGSASSGSGGEAGSSGAPGDRGGDGGAMSGGASGSSSAGAAAGDDPGGIGGVAAEGGAAGDGSAGATACECSAGQCCDGCHFRPSTYQVGLGVFQMGCAVADTRLVTDNRYLNCTGVSATDVVWGNFPDTQATEGTNVLCSDNCADPCLQYQAFGLTAPFCAGRPYYPAGAPLPSTVPACF